MDAREGDLVQVLLLLDAVSRFCRTFLWSPELRNGELVRATEDPAELVSLKDVPWKQEVPTGPIPLWKWVSMTAYVECAASSEEGIRCLCVVAAGVVGQFYQRGWDKYCEDPWSHYQG